MKSGAPDRTRTCYRRLRRPVLYPDELRALGRIGKHAPDGHAGRRAAPHSVAARESARFPPSCYRNCPGNIAHPGPAAPRSGRAAAGPARCARRVPGPAGTARTTPIAGAPARPACRIFAFRRARRCRTLPSSFRDIQMRSTRWREAFRSERAMRHSGRSPDSAMRTSNRSCLPDSHTVAVVLLWITASAVVVVGTAVVVAYFALGRPDALFAGGSFPQLVSGARSLSSAIPAPDPQIASILRVGVTAVVIALVVVIGAIGVWDAWQSRQHRRERTLQRGEPSASRALSVAEGMPAHPMARNATRRRSTRRRSTRPRSRGPHAAQSPDRHRSGYVAGGHRVGVVAWRGTADERTPRIPAERAAASANPCGRRDGDSRPARHSAIFPFAHSAPAPMTASSRRLSHRLPRREVDRRRG